MGGSVDRACKLEAMLCSLSNRRKALRIEQSKIDNQFIRFMNELQHSLQNDEDLTVILADAFSVPVENTKTDVTYIDQGEKTAEAEEERNDYPQKPPLERATTPPLESFRPGRFACFAGGVFGDDVGSRDQATDLLHSWANPELSPFRGSQDTDADAALLFPSSSHPSPSAMRAGAQAWREQHGRDAATDNTINFRTGMSGHMALLSTQSHPHEYLEPSHSRLGSATRMSSHTGLPMFKIPSLQGILNSLTLPVIGTPPRRVNSQGQIHHTGSM